MAVFRAVDGLPALRSLALAPDSHFSPRGFVPALLASPLAARLVELAGVHPTLLATADLPNLRNVVLDHPDGLEALVERFGDRLQIVRSRLG